MIQSKSMTCDVRVDEIYLLLFLCSAIFHLFTPNGTFHFYRFYHFWNYPLFISKVHCIWVSGQITKLYRLLNNFFIKENRVDPDEMLRGLVKNN